MKHLKATFTALALGLTASMANAGLSPAEVEAINGKSGIRVYASDGGFVGVTNGLRINQDRTRMFLIPRSGSIFRLRSKDVAVTTKTDKLSLRDGKLIIDADTQRLRIKASSPSSSDGGGIVTILLLH